MGGIKLVVALGVVAVAYGFPRDEGSSSLVTGVFIPSEAFKNLQDRANANSPDNRQPIQGGQPNPGQNQQPNYQPANPNQPQYQPPVMTNQQPPLNNQSPRLNNQPPVLTNQPGMTTQPMGSNIQPMSNNQQPIVYTQQPLTANRDPNQPITVMTNQPNGQSTPPNIVYVQQPSTNQPIYVQQPNQGYAQPSQPTQVIFTNNPNGNQGTFVTSPNQNQPGSTIYTLIPLNGQYPNSGGSYNSNPIILSSGK